MDPDRARELLARERERIMRDLQTKAPDPPPDSDVTDPADKATDTYDAELDESFADGLREQLEAVERAEQRLADGTYGLSIESGEPIPDERLELEPTAERTVVEQDRFDRGF